VGVLWGLGRDSRRPFFAIFVSFVAPVMQGDPSKPGICVIRVHSPNGVMSNNHRHREDRHGVVLQGGRGRHPAAHWLWAV
jgi:hypothetical protein